MNQLLLFRRQMTPIRKLLMMHLSAGGTLIEESATGNPLSFETNIAKPLSLFSTAFTPTQSGSGDPYPPGGGKNLCPPSPFERGQYSSGVWMADVARITSDYIPIEPHTNYMISVDADNTANVALINYNLFDSSKNWLGSRSENGDSSFNGDKTHLLNATFNDTAYVRLTVRDATNTASSLSGITLADADLMLEKGSSATSYAPYSNIRPISGWTGVNAKHFPENLLVINRSGDQTANGVTWTRIVQNNVPVMVHAKGTRATPNVFYNLYDSTQKMNVQPGTYKAYGYTDNVGIFVFYYDSNGAETSAYKSNRDGNISFTIPSDALRSWVRLQVLSESEVDETVYPILLHADDPINTYPVVFPALGKNLFDGELEQGGIIGNSGAETGSTERVRTKGFIPLTEGQYTISAVGVGQVYYYSYNMDGTYNVEESSGFKNLPFTINVLGDRKYRFAFRVSSSSEAISPSDVSNVQIEEGSSATAYEPFTSTCYGGTLDLVTGVLKVEWKSANIGLLNWTYVGGANLFYTSALASEIVAPDSSQALPDAISSVYSASSAARQTNLCFAVGGNGVVMIIDSNYSDAETFKDDMDGELIVYKLTASYTVQLTPQQITSLIGTNTMWADTNGDCSVTYLKRG